MIALLLSGADPAAVLQLPVARADATFDAHPLAGTSTNAVVDLPHLDTPSQGTTAIAAGTSAVAADLGGSEVPNPVLITASPEHGCCGRAWVHALVTPVDPAQGWLRVATLEPTDAAAGQAFGGNKALAAAGGVVEGTDAAGAPLSHVLVVVGAWEHPAGGSTRGAVWVFSGSNDQGDAGDWAHASSDGGEWVHRATLTASDGADNHRFGRTVAVSSESVIAVASTNAAQV